MQERAALALNDRAENLSSALPALLVEAHRIAATVIIGVHGRKRSGPGETFWQYRPYSFGDNVQQIDWHRSARSDRVFIRENEWEAANTLWLWVSPSIGMTFQSHLATIAKSERAKLLALAVASLALRAGTSTAGRTRFAPGFAIRTVSPDFADSGRSPGASPSQASASSYSANAWTCMPRSRPMKAKLRMPP